MFPKTFWQQDAEITNGSKFRSSGETVQMLQWVLLPCEPNEQGLSADSRLVRSRRTIPAWFLLQTSKQSYWDAMSLRL